MTFLIIVYGLIIGSFLNVCVYRIPRSESIAWPGSHCPKCKHKLHYFDNIPLFSWIFLRGRCRYCNESISIQYPLVETLNAILYFIMYRNFGLTLDFIFYSLLSSVLLTIIFIDLQQMIIPDVLIITILILSILHKSSMYFIGYSPEILNSILGSLLAGGLFLAIVLVFRGGMGGGDVTLISALGFVIGWRKIMLTIFLSFILGSIISIFLLATKLKTRKDPIPFGPFIIIAFFITLLWGQAIMNWYLRLFI